MVSIITITACMPFIGTSAVPMIIAVGRRPCICLAGPLGLRQERRSCGEAGDVDDKSDHIRDHLKDRRELLGVSSKSGRCNIGLWTHLKDDTTSKIPRYSTDVGTDRLGR